MNTLDSFSLKGKVAVVTGAGTGIGYGISKGLIEAGADIFAIYNSHYPTDLEHEAKKDNVGFYAVRMDLSCKENWHKVIEEAVNHFGKVDILVNNSGTVIRSPVLEHTAQEWNSVVQLNQNAVFFIAQAAAQQFVKQGTRGKIINIASMLSYLGGFNCCSYTASKHAVMGITRVMASELASKNINVNAIAPGWIKTNLSAPLREDQVRSKMVVDRIPAGHWGEIDDFKGVAAFLASSASDYITGVCIPVDGGYLVK